MRNAVAPGLQRQVLEDEIGETAIGGRIADPLLRLDQGIGPLRLVADMEAEDEVRKIEFLAIRLFKPITRCFTAQFS
ncbi:hypothetical protein GCM10011390_10180 [Aureimonas endophytica]|uniref:Uncharacterized protein n=1 Tax=Aureimonas endophytica TaxID=2027858 RepID=A0A916ZEY6_9HYPH|nr:hypothetical protein GCM10011390_10180 [Aureimonas endophytica]